MHSDLNRLGSKASLLRSVVLPVAGFAAFAAGVFMFACLMGALYRYDVKTPDAFAWVVGILLAFGPPIVVGRFVLRAARRIDEASVVTMPAFDWGDEREAAAEREAAVAASEDDARPKDSRPPAREETPFEVAVALARAAPTASRSSGVFFALTLILFFATSGESSIANAVILALVLLVHELGHFAAMKVFGYDNPRIFFLPLFGAATTGSKQGGPGWQEVLVLLAGPLPGIVAGIAMLATGAAPRGTTAHTVATYLIVINAFNLLPLQALDGGRVLNRLVFSRHPVAEAVGTAMMSIAMMAIGFKLKTPILMMIGAFGLIRLSPSLMLSRGAVALRTRWPSVTSGLRTAPETYVADLHDVAVGHLGATARKPDTIARWMRELHERVVSRPVAFAASFALLLAYGAAFLGGVVGVVMTWRR